MTDYATQYAQSLQQKFDRERQATARFNAKHGHTLPSGKNIFEVEQGKRYDRIVQFTEYPRENHPPQRTVHAFVERSTGKLIKAAGWKAPAKRSDGELQSKFDLSTPSGFQEAVEASDLYGSYLYIK